jgi:hypothetical protein
MRRRRAGQDVVEVADVLRVGPLVAAVKAARLVHDRRGHVRARRAAARRDRVRRLARAAHAGALIPQEDVLGADALLELAAEELHADEAEERQGRAQIYSIYGATIVWCCVFD